MNLRLLSLGFPVALLATSVCAQGTSPNPEATYKAGGAAASKPRATIRYGRHPLQEGDLRLPKGKGPFPVAAVVHGGCWMASVDGRKGISGFADALTKRGVATWTISYRRTGDSGGGWPGTFQDIAAGVDKIADLAKTYPLDLKRVALIGHSAGAHAVLWAASRPKLPAPWTSNKIKPIFVAAIDGPGALTPFVGIDEQVCDDRPVISLLMGGKPADKPADYAIVDTTNYLPFRVRQLSVGADLAQLMRPYVQSVRASGDDIIVLEPPKANHFDVVTPGSPNGEAVLDFIMSRGFGVPLAAKSSTP